MNCLCVALLLWLSSANVVCPAAWSSQSLSRDGLETRTLTVDESGQVTGTNRDSGLAPTGGANLGQ